MQVELSPENVAFLQSQVAAGRFDSGDSALNAAVGLLKKRSELLAKIDRSVEQLDNGQCIELDEEGLEKFFNELFDIAGAQEPAK
jgi:Arc/MetJ-type ribon-helix-helix transcriptional regulator